MSPSPLPDAQHLEALSWLTTLARAFVLPVLGCALLLFVAPRLPAWARRLGPGLVRASLVLLVLAAYGPVAGELTLWGPDDPPLYRVASLVVVGCALALVVVLPLLAEGLASPRPEVAPIAVPPPLPAPEALAPAAAPTAPRPPPATGRQPTPRTVYPSAAFAAGLASAEAPALPFVTAEVVSAPAPRPAEAPDATAGRPRPPGLATDVRAARPRLTPPRVAPVSPEETVRVPSLRPRRPPPPPEVEPLPPTHAIPAPAQARLLEASGGTRTERRLLHLVRTLTG